MLNIVTPEVIVDHQEYGIATKMSKKSILDAVPPRIFMSPGQQRKTRKFSTGDAKLTPGAYHVTGSELDTEGEVDTCKVKDAFHRWSFD